MLSGKPLPAGCAKKQKALDNSPELLAQLRFV
jgi:hypothetical protein